MSGLHPRRRVCGYSSSTVILHFSPLVLFSFVEHEIEGSYVTEYLRGCRWLYPIDIHQGEVVITMVRPQDRILLDQDCQRRSFYREAVIVVSATIISSMWPLSGTHPSSRSCWVRAVIQVLRTYALYQCDLRVLALLLSVAVIFFCLDCVSDNF